MIWPPTAEPLEGAVVRLEPIDERHREGLMAAASDPATWAWIDRRVPGDAAAFTAWFEDRVRARGDGREWAYVTNLRDGERIVGSSSYLAPRPEHDGVEIGWTWLHPDAWRTGANRDAKLQMLEHAFERLGAMRVEFKTDARNGRSRDALEGIGARFEGIHRRHMLMPVVGVRDSAYFSICDDEWPAVRRRLRGRIEALAGDRG